MFGLAAIPRGGWFMSRLRPIVLLAAIRPGSPRPATHADEASAEAVLRDAGLTRISNSCVLQAEVQANQLADGINRGAGRAGDARSGNTRSSTGVTTPRKRRPGGSGAGPRRRPTSSIPRRSPMSGNPARITRSSPRPTASTGRRIGSGKRPGLSGGRSKPARGRFRARSSGIASWWAGPWPITRCWPPGPRSRRRCGS